MAVSFPIYLTGSHVFGGATVDSDIDFYAEYSPSLEVYLAHRGFYRYERSSKAICRTNLVCVMKHPVLKIDIQLVKNVGVKHKIQENIIKYGLQPLLRNKQLAFLFWQYSTDLVLEK